MSSSVLEQIRTHHEMVELYERAVSSQMDEKPSGVSARALFACT